MVGQPAPKEEKEFLDRNEIKTMKKDIAVLREGQAVQEREKVAELKTEEELQKEKERQERASQTALERKLAEKEAEKKQDELVKIREERQKMAETVEEEKIAQTEEKTKGFRDILKETQIKEEQERKAFLERVSAPAAPPPPLPKESSWPKPSPGQKLWIRIVLTLLVLAILAAIGTFWYWYLAVREKSLIEKQTSQEQEIVKEVTLPPALISVEASRTLNLSSLNQTLQENLGQNKFTRLIIKSPTTNGILGLREFFEAFEIKTPAGFYDKLDNNFTLFVYSSSQGINRLGFVAKIKEPDLMPLVKSWESTLEQDFGNLSILLGKTGPSPVSYFREAKYKDTDASFRYLSFPPQNFGLCWAIINDYFILTFSGESIIKTIDKIND